MKLKILFSWHNWEDKIPLNNVLKFSFLDTTCSSQVGRVWVICDIWKKLINTLKKALSLLRFIEILIFFVLFNTWIVSFTLHCSLTLIYPSNGYELRLRFVAFIMRFLPLFFYLTPFMKSDGVGKMYLEYECKKPIRKLMEK